MISTRNIKDLFTRDKAFVNLIEAEYSFRDAEIESEAKVLSCGSAYLSSATYDCENSECTLPKRYALPVNIDYAPHVAKK